MTGPWFTRSGATGHLQIEYQDDGWYVTSSDADTTIKCLFGREPEFNEGQGSVSIEATVSRYARGRSDDPDYLHIDEARQLEPGEQPTSEEDSLLPDNAGPMSTSSSKSESSSSSRSSTPSDSPEEGKRKGSLHKIAQDKIGDKEFTVSREDESVVGRAKKRAKEQGRDPAIDPRLQEDEKNKDE